MKVKTSELTGAALDWAVAIAEGIPAEELKLPSWKNDSLFRYLRDAEGELDGRYVTGPDLLFSCKWEAGGPIIERENIWTKPGVAFVVGDRGEYLFLQTGPTLLIAAMRCYVASKMGDEVEIPEELHG